MKIKNKLMAGLLTAAMTITSFTAFGSSVFAAEETGTAAYEAGSYVGTVKMYKAKTTDFVDGNLSMCNPIFAPEADVVVTADSTTVTIYVAEPIPAFPTMGTPELGGTVKDVKATYNNTQYTAALDLTTLAEKNFAATNALFGINAGDVLPTEAVTFTLPADAVNHLGEGIEVEAYVNAVMNSTQNFIMTIADLSGKPTTKTDSMEVTAEVVASSATYDVLIPDSVAMGALSAEADNTKSYDVKVTVSGLKDGESIKISAPKSGSLTCGDNTLAFVNSFGTQTITSDQAETSLTGTLTVKAADVAKAAAGNYTGTTNFSISYYAE